MSAFDPPEPPSTPHSPNAPPSGGGFGGPPGGGFGAPPGGGFGPPGGGFGGPPGGGGMEAPPEKPSSSRKGCLIALAVVVGLAGLCTCTGLGLAAFGIYSNPELRRGFEAMGGMVGLMREAAQDPGAQALVSAGCEEALAFDLAELAEIARQIDPDDAPYTGPGSPEMVVVCSDRGGAPSCDELARVFVSAHRPAPSSFALSVQPASGEAACANLYGPDGALIRALTPEEQIGVPSAPPAPPQGAPAPPPAGPK